MIMKKMIDGLFLPLLMANSALAACDWNSAEQIYQKWRWIGYPVYTEIKACRLGHVTNIPYKVSDLLDNPTKPGIGTVIPLGVVTGDENLNTDPTLSLNVSLNNPLETPPPYYLTSVNNSTTDPKRLGLGLFRFYTKVNTYACIRDSLGNKWIRNNGYESFFKGRNVRVVNFDGTAKAIAYLSSVSGVIASAKNIKLKSGTSTLIADLDFIEGQVEQNPSRHIIGEDKICTIDIYARLRIYPLHADSQLLQRGYYNFTITVN